MVAPVVGALSDRVGRRSVLVVAVFTLCVLPVPLYAVAAGGSTIGLIVSSATIGSALAALVLPAYLSECFLHPYARPAWASPLVLRAHSLAARRLWWQPHSITAGSLMPPRSI
jgi:MFS family permease